MTVYEFTKLNKCLDMYRLIDATQRGYMTTPNALLEADVNVVRRLYGNSEVVGFAAIGKGKLSVFIIPEED